jgi:hypothetical protein
MNSAAVIALIELINNGIRQLQLSSQTILDAHAAGREITWDDVEDARVRTATHIAELDEAIARAKDEGR